MTRHWTMRDGIRVAVPWLIAITMAGSAGAQTTEKISNHSTSTTGASIGGSERNRDQFAQAFTTGSHTSGYDLEKIVLYIADWPAITDELAVSLHSASGTTIGGKLRDMTPGSTTTGLVDWTPVTNIPLGASTTYYVKAHNTTTGTLAGSRAHIRVIQEPLAKLLGLAAWRSPQFSW